MHCPSNGAAWRLSCIDIVLVAHVSARTLRITPRLSDGWLVQNFALPGIGSIGGFSGSRKGTEFFYSFQSE